MKGAGLREQEKEYMKPIRSICCRQRQVGARNTPLSSVEEVVGLCV